eukprot:8958268-Pyramimonas_sp.AAC.2
MVPRYMWSAELSVGDACGTQPLGPSAELLWGHETREGRADMNAGGACGLSLWTFGGAPIGPGNV